MPGTLLVTWLWHPRSIFACFWTSFLTFYRFLGFFFWKAGRAREWEIFFLLLCSQNAHNGQGWTRLKLGDRSWTWISHLGGRDPSSWVIPCCLPACTLVGSFSSHFFCGLISCGLYVNSSKRHLGGISLPWSFCCVDRDCGPSALLFIASHALILHIGFRNISWSIHLQGAYSAEKPTFSKCDKWIQVLCCWW